LSPFFL
jgi:chromosome segregation ATPase